ncbi:MAG: anthranilate synthase component I, partial [Methylophaga sp.]|nr:anthranilate synthase component I [Methylophaga sp.]
MNQAEFDQLAEQGYNRIPLAREVLADLDTPLSTYLKLADAPYSYLLESVHGGEKWGRYSIIGLPSETIVRITGQDIEVKHCGKVIETTTSDDPLSWIETFKQQYKVPDLDNLPRFNGGLVGYFGYDTVRYVEPRLGACPNPDPLDCPDILLMVSNDLIVFDNLSGRLFLIVHADPNTDNAYQTAQKSLDTLTTHLRTATPKYSS